MKKLLFFGCLSAVLLSVSTSAQAQILQGTTTVNAANNMVITVTVNTQTDVVDITATGPNGAWFGYGFGGSSMTNTYSMITDGSGLIVERKLGNHTSGSLLTSSFSSTSTALNGGLRTTMASRNRVGANSSYFTFPNTAGTFTIIWAKGSGPSLNTHLSNNRGTAIITLTDCTALIDTSVTPVSNGLTANHTGPSVSYQWIDCLTNTPVVGATNQTLVAPSSSNYRVKITDGGCVDSSGCSNVVLFAIDEFALNGVKLYPNPATNSFTVEVVNAAPYKVSLLNSVGQVIFIEEGSQSKTTLHIEDLTPGIYMVEVLQSGKIFRQKLVKH